jgi:hypothetical protein
MNRLRETKELVRDTTSRRLVRTAEIFEILEQSDHYFCLPFAFCHNSVSGGRDTADTENHSGTGRAIGD